MCVAVCGWSSGWPLKMVTLAPFPSQSPNASLLVSRNSQPPTWLHTLCTGVCDAAAAGAGGPAAVTGPGLEPRSGRHGSWRHSGSSHAGQGEILSLLTFPNTDTLQAWEGLGRAAQASRLQEQAPG